MKIDVTVENIKYENIELTTENEVTFQPEHPLTVVTAMVMVNDVYIEGKYHFRGVLDSRSEIAKMIEKLYT